MFIISANQVIPINKIRVTLLAIQTEYILVVNRWRGCIQSKDLSCQTEVGIQGSFLLKHGIVFISCVPLPRVSYLAKHLADNTPKGSSDIIATSRRELRRGIRREIARVCSYERLLCSYERLLCVG